tara:strand:- start:273 stop:503 length:231 start_codon:yes stop_codon:yes gene_type:complete
MAREPLYKKKKKEMSQGIDMAKLDRGDIRILKDHFGLSSKEIRALKPKDFDDYMNRFENQYGDTDYMYRIRSGRQD